jgi:hypothetical protein
LGAANEKMFLEAFNQGLIMHEMDGFDIQKVREVFNIVEDLRLFTKMTFSITLDMENVNVL